MVTIFGRTGGGLGCTIHLRPPTGRVKLETFDLTGTGKLERVLALRRSWPAGFVTDPDPVALAAMIQRTANEARVHQACLAHLARIHDQPRFDAAAAILRDLAVQP